MRTIKYEQGEKVRIEVEVTGVEVRKDTNVYYLKNPQTGYPFDFMFAEDQLFPAGGTDGED